MIEVNPALSETHVLNFVVAKQIRRYHSWK